MVGPGVSGWHSAPATFASVHVAGSDFFLFFLFFFDEYRAILVHTPPFSSPP